MKRMTQTHGTKLVLLADGDHGSRQTTTGLLHAEGYQCHTVADAYQAVALLQADRYDLLIADTRIPGNDDLQLVRDSQEVSPQMPVILISSCPSAESALQAFQLPVMAYLQKPFRPEELRSQVRRCLEQSQVYGTVHRVLRHLEGCVQDLEELRDGQLASRTAIRSPTVAVQVGTIRHLASCLSELLALEAVLTSAQPSSGLCELLDCPQRPVYCEAMRETVDVLHRTKGAFKSREIGQLRLRLEKLLKNPGPPPVHF